MWCDVVRCDVTESTEPKGKGKEGRKEGETLRENDHAFLSRPCSHGEAKKDGELVKNVTLISATPKDP
jgi:hypothetical protein